jgi:hypothetical protein
MLPSALFHYNMVNRGGEDLWIVPVFGWAVRGCGQVPHFTLPLDKKKRGGKSCFEKMEKKMEKILYCRPLIHHFFVLDLFHRMELPDPNYICKFSLG